MQTELRFVTCIVILLTLGDRLTHLRQHMIGTHFLLEGIIDLVGNGLIACDTDINTCILHMTDELYIYSVDGMNGVNADGEDIQIGETVHQGTDDTQCVLTFDLLGDTIH